MATQHSLTQISPLESAQLEPDFSDSLHQFSLLILTVSENYFLGHHPRAVSWILLLLMC